MGVLADLVTLPFGLLVPTALCGDVPFGVSFDPSTPLAAGAADFGNVPEAAPLAESAGLTVPASVAKAEATGKARLTVRHIEAVHILALLNMIGSLASWG